ncbi:hypothetical protein HMPREF1991_01760 [Hoylesella loescheii DSM 19665 = JCM 12249 = ATCC 15930]|uniref:Uncharacterized protein n=1 Tax=Hoylesella loescheii DSM 19665 = JCM 12249 = ATCC 15930 TaxID=1122985 RepID=A0A069QHB2_HOYLO|nr:hypothetical protein HMPREF1991_01760 [Hoylesella loescheii DSM 19665 = JCM 12249 = ATCC 15930]
MPNITYTEAFAYLYRCIYTPLALWFINLRAGTSILECCSTSSGTLFHHKWNRVPSYMEHCYTLAITWQVLKKHTTRAYFTFSKFRSCRF